MEVVELTEREKTVLRYVIHQFVLTASPVGSRYITKKYDVGFSPATVRNIMSDLEDYGYLNHPHTSAGRVPTDKGYRLYVDSLMAPPKLNEAEKNLISQRLEKSVADTDELLKVTSSILSQITNQLACVTFPKLDQAVLEKIQIVSLSSTRVMIIVALRSGLVNTITMEIDSKVSQKNLEAVQKILNQRLSGLKISEIKNTLKERIQDVSNSEFKPVIRLFVDSADKIFSDSNKIDQSIITGTKNILTQPEFENHEELQGIIELIEDKEVIVHILGLDEKEDKDFQIIIGSEIESRKLQNFSFVKSTYKIGEATGILSVVGPKRMQYSKAVAAIIYLAETLSKELKKIS